MPVNGLFSAIDISSTGLMAQRKLVNVVARNIANVKTTRNEQGEPYKKRFVVMRDSASRSGFRSIMRNVSAKLITTDASHISTPRLHQSRFLQQSGGVEAEERVSEDQEPRMIFDPSHPDANEEGYVAMPSINLIEEMVDLMTASRAYEANITVIDASKMMLRQAIEI